MCFTYTLHKKLLKAAANSSRSYNNESMQSAPVRDWPYFDASEKTGNPPIETYLKEQNGGIQNFGEVIESPKCGKPQAIFVKQQRLSGHRYISVFDFASGFYAVEVDQESRHTQRFT